MPKVWVLRIAIVVVAFFSVRAATTTWVDHDVPVVVRGPATPAAPHGALTPTAVDFRCSAPLSGAANARPIELRDEIVSMPRRPCSPFRTGRRVLVYIDVVVLALGLALTFASVRRVLRSSFALRRDRR